MTSPARGGFRRCQARAQGLGFDPDVVRNVSIAMYEGEINMVIHAGGGEIDVEISPDCIQMVLADHGPGIKDVELAEGGLFYRAGSGAFPWIRRGDGAPQY